jgi:hypothetical protein
MKSKEQLREESINLMKELRPLLDEVKGFAEQLHTRLDSLPLSVYELIEDRLVGIYTFINPKYKEYEAKADGYEAIYYNALKLKSEVDGTKFVSEVSTRQAREYTEDVRLTAAVLEGWVKSIEQTLITCRAHSYRERQESKYVR